MIKEIKYIFKNCIQNKFVNKRQFKHFVYMTFNQQSINTIFYI